MHLTKNDLQTTERVKRLNIINSISGIKPANLIGTASDDGKTNLAIFSSVIHLGSNPALLGFILRPADEVPRHTYENIQANGFYTINHVPTAMIENAHYTSAKFDHEISEFERCGFHEEYIDGFSAPFVKESPLKIGMRFIESIPININNTTLVIGEVEHLIVLDEAMTEKGYINLEICQTAGISGLNSYYNVQKIMDFPYARPHEVPDFKQKA